MDARTVRVHLHQSAISVYSERGFLRDEVHGALVKRATNQLPIRSDSVRRAFKAGVRIGAGTDITPSMPTMRHGETRSSWLPSYARACPPPTISAGKLADTVIVSRDPEADIGALEHDLAYVLKTAPSSSRRRGSGD